MSKSKMHKQEVGRSRPTENAVSASIANQKINEWVNRIREAGKINQGEQLESASNRITNILIELIQQTKQGKIEREVISGVVGRLGLHQSLIKAQERLNNVAGKRNSG
jgi:hypothetical protein